MYPAIFQRFQGFATNVDSLVCGATERECRSENAINPLSTTIGLGNARFFIRKIPNEGVAFIGGTSTLWLTMFSSNMKQFKLRDILGAFILAGVGMALLANGWGPAVTLGTLILVGITGGLAAVATMTTSDFMDDRRIDDRRWSSRVVNGIGLLLILATLLTVLLLGVVFSGQIGIWLLDQMVTLKGIE